MNIKFLTLLLYFISTYAFSQNKAFIIKGSISANHHLSFPSIAGEYYHKRHMVKFSYGGGYLGWNRLGPLYWERQENGSYYLLNPKKIYTLPHEDYVGILYKSRSIFLGTIFKVSYVYFVKSKLKRKNEKTKSHNQSGIYFGGEYFLNNIHDHYKTTGFTDTQEGRNYQTRKGQYNYTTYGLSGCLGYQNFIRQRICVDYSLSIPFFNVSEKYRPGKDKMMMPFYDYTNPFYGPKFIFNIGIGYKL